MYTLYTQSEGVYYFDSMPFLTFYGCKCMSIFNFIENISYEIGNHIGRNDTDDDKELYGYAIFALLSQTFTFGTGFILAYLFGCFVPFLIVVISFIMLRIGGGGYHCSCFRNCYITSLVIFFLGTILSYVGDTAPILMLFIGIFAGIFIFPICPKPSENSPSRGYKGDIKFRKKYRNALLLLIIANLLFIHYNMFLYASAVSCGIIVTSIMISDTGEKIIDGIWRKLK